MPLNSPSHLRVVADAAEHLDALMGRLQRGHGDPTMRRVGRLWFRAAHPTSGPVLLELRPQGLDVRVTAWGAGGLEALEQVPRLLGVGDDWAAFVPAHPRLADAARRHPPRLGATGALAETLVPTVIEQRVTGAEAFASIRTLTRRFGDRAPGPGVVEGHPAQGMHCPPTATQWSSVPSWDFLRAGVDAGRMRTALRLLARLPALERTLTASAPSSRLDQALRGFPGVGVWTSAKVRQRVLGDPDAWSEDDFHVPRFVASALGGPGTPAERASELLEAHRPHRYRVELLLMSSGAMAERHGARRSLPTHLPTSWGVTPGRGASTR